MMSLFCTGWVVGVAMSLLSGWVLFWMVSHPGCTVQQGEEETSAEAAGGDDVKWTVR